MTRSDKAAITPRKAEIDASQGAAFDPVAVGRDFLHTGRVAALSTLDPGGFPYGIVTNVMPDADGSPVFFAARIALHARNILNDSRISLSWASFNEADMVTKPRMTLVGHAAPVSGAQDGWLRARYLRRFPKSRLYLQLPDAVMFRVEVLGVTIGGGPARNAGAVTFADLRHDLSGAEDLIAAEEALLEEANKAGILSGAGGAGSARRRIVSLDPDGVDIEAGNRLTRHVFSHRITSAEALRAVLRQEAY